MKILTSDQGSENKIWFGQSSQSSWDEVLVGDIDR